jgi:hypothetical protein
LTDLPRDQALVFNEGTWANFVDWRRFGTFVWRYPSPECLERGVGYVHDQENPFLNPQAAHWQMTRKRIGLWGIPWASVKAVGVCLSPDWVGGAKIIAEPLAKLRIRRWLQDVERGQTLHHRPKFVRVKV